MPFSIEDKFVVTIASSALFNLGEADKIFQESGPEEYRKYQQMHINDTLEPGAAFPFIKRLLNLNNVFPEQHPVEVVLLSRNSPETGVRVFNSIKEHSLDISRGAFFSGDSPYKYLPAFNTTLFLTANTTDVANAIKAGYPAGVVISSEFIDDDGDELRLAFDFDGVIADDEAEKVYKESGSLKQYHDSEVAKSWTPLNPGPLKDMLQKISYFQKLERKKQKDDPSYKRLLQTSIVTARNAPAHERMINTLKSWDIFVDNAFFMGGIEKRRVLEIMRPHLFFDDHTTHLNSTKIPQVHIPFGIANVV
jgi:5'-nucleotidase